jgi:hypothetical protein
MIQIVGQHYVSGPRYAVLDRTPKSVSLGLVKLLIVLR